MRSPVFTCIVHRLPGQNRSRRSIREARPRSPRPAPAPLGDDPQRAERADDRIVDAIAGEPYVQMHLGRSGGDDSAKIPFAVVPIRAGPSEKVAEVGAGLIPYPHPAPGQPVMREMQCLQQSRFVAGIQCRHEAVEYRECCAYRSLIRLGLSLVDSDEALRTLSLRLFLLTFVSLKFPEVFRLTSRFWGVVVLGSLPRSFSGHSIFTISAPRVPNQRVAHGPARTQLKSTTRMFSRARGRTMVSFSCYGQPQERRSSPGRDARAASR